MFLKNFSIFCGLIHEKHNLQGSKANKGKEENISIKVMTSQICFNRDIKGYYLYQEINLQMPSPFQEKSLKFKFLLKIYQLLKSEEKSLQIMNSLQLQQINNMFICLNLNFFQQTEIQVLKSHLLSTIQEELIKRTKSSKQMHSVWLLLLIQTEYFFCLRGGS
ncbi:unnamed protein product [Paramecium octaurelia]|uniref:Uncharacterized protein n=1 Tax=Paramecium octaurelia TaxID=43137 RepID=A0A8S1TCA7_PAROT|nr:unnamed protein product [Paramecium octaurelia]